MNVLFIDNYDSFVYNSVDEFARRGCTVSVWRNDVPAGQALELALEMTPPRLIVLSPGPGKPSDAGCCVELVKRARRRVPVFGICLGHQAIVEALGGTVEAAGEIVHGKASRIEHDGAGILAGLPSPFTIGRYHSLATRRLPDELRVLARLDDICMAADDPTARLCGVQFHPESILTPDGGALLENVISWAAETDERSGRRLER